MSATTSKRREIKHQNVMRQPRIYTRGAVFGESVRRRNRTEGIGKGAVTTTRTGERSPFSSIILPTPPSYFDIPFYFDPRVLFDHPPSPSHLFRSPCSLQSAPLISITPNLQNAFPRARASSISNNKLAHSRGIGGQEKRETGEKKRSTH